MKYTGLISVAVSALILLCGCGGKGANTPSTLLENGQYEAAAEGFIEQLKGDEKNPELYIGLADAYLGQGEYEAAVDILCDGFDESGKEQLTDKMIEITSDLYKTATEKTDYQVVLYCCDRVLECGEFARIYEYKAMCYINMEQHDKVIETVNEGFEKTKDNTIAENVAGYFYTLGSKAYTSGNKKSALEYFNKVIEIDGDNEDAKNMIGAIGDNPQDSTTKKEDTEKTDKQEEAPKKVPEEKPVTAEVTPAPAPEPTVMYTVQIGAYSSKENADSKIAKAKAAGLSASSYVSNGLYRVTIGSFSSESEAAACVSNANAAGFDAIIIQ